MTHLRGLLLALATLAMLTLAANPAPVLADANRSTPTQSNTPGGIDDTTYADDVNDEVVDLHRRAPAFLTNVGGTANAITAQEIPTLGAYEQGNRHYLIPEATNTGPVTINIDGLGARAVVSPTGAALDAGELVDSRLAELVDDGTQLRLIRVPQAGGAAGGGGGVIDRQVFDASGTWNRPTDDEGAPLGTVVHAQCWGAGGSGGGGASTNRGGGGGGGAWAEVWLDSTTVGGARTVTIGQGGAPVTGNTGGNAGGTSSFGTLLFVPGGGGGGAGSGGRGGGGGAGVFESPGNGGVIGGPGASGGEPGGGAGGAAGVNGGAATSAYGGGGGGGGTHGSGGRAWFGGGGGGANASTAGAGISAGGDSFMGGAGGAGATTTGSVPQGGNSVHGGDGGTGGHDGGTESGGNGGQPGGGGGGSVNGAASGAGGDGRCIVAVY